MAKQGYLGAFYAKVLDKVVEDCEDAWDEKVDPDVTSEIDEVDYKEGSASVKLTVAGTISDGDILATEIVDLDLTNHRRITLWIKSLETVASGDLQLLLDESVECGSPEETLDIPALTADTWTAVTLTLSDPSVLDAVVSIGLKYTANSKANTIHIDAVKAISSLTVTDEAVDTGDGTTKEFDLDNANVDIDSLVVKVDGTVVKDYEVTVQGHITFVTAPGDTLAITASYTYWVVAQAGGFRNWSFSYTGDTVERTDFSSTGWKTFVGLQKGWTGSAEQFWLNEKWTDEITNLVIVKFYEDTGNDQRYEGWARLTGVDVSCAVDSLIMSPISFQGTGVLNYEST